MDTLHRLDDRLLTDVNDLARHTGWLHGAVLRYAGYGVVRFAALLLGGLSLRRTPLHPALAALRLRAAARARALAASGGAPIAVLLALALTQPLAAAFAEARPCPSHPG